MGRPRSLSAGVDVARYIVYLAYLTARLWRMRHDALFPLYDGWTYYAKAVYLSEAPRARLFSAEAFSLFSIRPPAPSWLTFPFVWVAPVFSSFALGLMFWTLVGVEWGVRCTMPRRRPWARLWLAVLVVAGVGPLYHGFELFYVDGLLAGMAVAALGSAIGWLRKGSLALAVAGGIWLFLAILTKPAGLVVAGSTGGVLAVGWVLKTWGKGRSPWSLRAPPRFWLAAAAWFAPVLAGIVIFLATPYRDAVAGAREAFSGATLSRHYLVKPWSLEGVRDYLHMVSRAVSIPVCAICVLVVALALWRLWRRGGRHRAVVTAGTTGVVAMALFTFVTPSRQLRFLAPVAAMGFLSVGAAVCAAWNRKRILVLGVIAVLTLLVRVALLSGTLPDSVLMGRPLPFSFPMQELREDLARIDEAIRCEGASLGRPTILATDTVSLLSCLKMVEWLNANATQRAACQLPPYSRFGLALPQWPRYLTTPLATFPIAQVLVVRCPTGEEQPPGSGSRDWQTVNTALWDPETAKRLGWVEAARREWYVLYVDTTPESEEFAIRKRRKDFLASLVLESPSSRRVLDFLKDAILPTGFSPPDRNTGTISVEAVAPAYLLHAEYRDNPLPTEMRFPFVPSTTLHLWMPRENAQGDGVVVELSLRRDGVWQDTRRVPLALGEKKAVSTRDLYDNTGTAPTELRIHIDPGPNDNAWNDLVSVEMVRKE